MFGFCITHILITGCAKIWKKKSVAKRLTNQCKLRKDVWINLKKKSPKYATVYYGESLPLLKNHQVSTVSEEKFFLSTPWGHRRKVQLQIQSFLPLVLDRSDWSTCPSHFTSGQRPLNTLNRRLDRPHNQPGWSGEETNLLLLPGFEPWIIQPVTYSLHSNYIISAPFNCQFVWNFLHMSQLTIFFCLVRFTVKLKYHTFFHEAAHLP